MRQDSALDQAPCVSVYRGMGHHVIVVATLALSSAIPSAPQVAPQPAEALARAIVPLLREVRSGVGRDVVIEPTTAPPSPITGRPSTLIAVRIGVKTVDVDARVVAAIDRLLAWNQREPLNDEDRALIVRWRDELRVELLGRLAGQSKGVGCDDDCVVKHVVEASSLFGDSRREQIQGRNEVLLKTLSDALEP